MKPVSFTKTGLDLLFIQFTWTLWALGIFLLIDVVKMIFQSNVDLLYSSGYIASNIYMLVIGIIVISFLTYFVENGITRTNYFYGNVIASIGLSIIIPIILYVLSLIEKFIVNQFTNIVLNENTLEDVVVDVDGNIIGEIIQAMILSPFISPESNLLLSLALFSLNILVFYIIGWLIGAAFKRLGVIGGILFIAIGIALIAVKDSMIRLAMDIPLFESFAFLDIVPEALALPLVFVVIVATFMMIRLLTKRAPIDI
ncbi:hypothetical protein J2Z83_002806 [Virgibacillus natechei]|uniref:ABC transporter permease n=1 Tax=Virgibacillus natechei TaxID=1216297 RepID=A0ABS4IJC5_9BACI|nr:hypothetical protein [Virgibacillus natechei]MBP1970670.1 hypothetical protein [Virgibacillus natechei]UZD13946.1 hypothetical protein OLD84_05265 [Virgibacillus natechei]